ncbi:MAG: hypothetical protein PHP74_03055 [Candidatus Gracilibacteria bacterium]|nr:hypothetical protein [Candidatus Gracilibacteria bacterium]
MFNEMRLVFRGLESSGENYESKGQPKGLMIDKGGSVPKRKFNPEKVEIDEVVYGKALTVMAAAGFDRVEADSILGDKTNPFFGVFMDFVEKMGADGYTVDLKTSGKGRVYFRLKGAVYGTPDFVVNMLNWKNKIYPGLMKNLGSSYNQKAMEFVIRYNRFGYNFYGIQKVMNDLVDGISVDAGSVAWAKWEMDQLKRGVAVAEIVRIERDRIKNGGTKIVDGKKAENEIADDGKGKQDSISLDDMHKEMREREEAMLTLFPKERSQFDSLVANVENIKTDEDLANYTFEVENLLDSVAKSNPQMSNLKDGLINVLHQIEPMLAEGRSAEEVSDFLQSEFRELGESAVYQEAVDTGDSDTVAAHKFYRDLIEAYLGGVGSRYGVDLD